MIPESSGQIERIFQSNYGFAEIVGRYINEPVDVLHNNDLYLFEYPKEDEKILKFFLKALLF